MSLKDQTIESVSLLEFCKFQTEQPSFDECVHIVIEDNNMTLYRKVNEGYPNERIQTKVENIRFRTMGEMPFKSDSFCLHNDRANNFLNWLELLAKERTDTSISFKYYQKNNSKMMEKTNINVESLIFEYSSESDRTRRCNISDTWQNKIHLMLCTNLR